jgi:hypothetical protein
MTFKKGVSGNPDGKAKGTLSKRSQLGKLLEPHGEQLINKAVELAKAGDIHALRLCLERLLPRVREESISLEVPAEAVNNAASLLAFSTRIIHATTTGEITPEQANKLFSVINVQREVIALAHLEDRVLELENIYKREGKIK